VGLVNDGQVLLDLDYSEDSTCDTDMNVVMTDAQGLVEVQGTAEGRPFSRAQVDSLLDLAAQGIGRLATLQRQALG
jgi:ribonuclease PH